MNQKRWREAYVTDDHQSIAEGNEDSNGKQYCRHPSIACKQKRKHDESGENVSNAFNPHIGKTAWVVNWNPVTGRCAGWNQLRKPDTNP